MRDSIKTQTQTILCPECNNICLATIEHTVPFSTYIHNCERCKYIITESDWNPVEPNHFQPTNGTDFGHFYFKNCDKCSKEKRCKYIKDSMVNGVPFEVGDDCNCIHIKPHGTPNKKRTHYYNKEQTNFLEELE